MRRNSLASLFSPGASTAVPTLLGSASQREQSQSSASRKGSSNRFHLQLSTSASDKETQMEFGPPSPRRLLLLNDASATLIMSSPPPTPSILVKRVEYMTDPVVQDLQEGSDHSGEVSLSSTSMTKDGTDTTLSNVNESLRLLSVSVNPSTSSVDLSDSLDNSTSQKEDPPIVPGQDSAPPSPQRVVFAPLPQLVRKRKPSIRLGIAARSALLNNNRNSSGSSTTVPSPSKQSFTSPEPSPPLVPLQPSSVSSALQPRNPLYSNQAIRPVDADSPLFSTDSFVSHSNPDLRPRLHPAELQPPAEDRDTSFNASSSDSSSSCASSLNSSEEADDGYNCEDNPDTDLCNSADNTSMRSYSSRGEGSDEDEEIYTSQVHPSTSQYTHSQCHPSSLAKVQVTPKHPVGVQGPWRWIRKRVGQNQEKPFTDPAAVAAFDELLASQPQTTRRAAA